MGSAASIASIPDRVDLDLFRTLAGDKFDQQMFDAYAVAGSDGQRFINKTKLLKLTEKTDVFLTHDWGTDELGRSNHERVSRINKGLKARGFITWFDEEQMTGSIVEQMCAGIDNTQCVVVCVTERYMEKVGGKNAADNCKKEFNYADQRKTAAKMVSAVMEPRMRNSSAWEGPLGMILGGKLYVDLTDDDQSVFEKALDELAKQIRLVITPLREQKEFQLLQGLVAAEGSAKVVESVAVPAAQPAPVQTPVPPSTVATTTTTSAPPTAAAVSPHFATASFRRLFTEAKITDEPQVVEYLTALSNNRVYNVHILLHRLASKANQAANVTLRELGIHRPPHAIVLGKLLTGDGMEETLREKGILKAADCSGDWTQLLDSLDIVPADQLAAAILDKVGFALSEFVELVREESGMWEQMSSDVATGSALFQEEPGLLSLIGQCLQERVKRTAKILFPGHKEVLRGHKGMARCLALLPNNMLASGGDDATIKLWNLAKKKCEKVLQGHNTCVFCIALLPDGRLISGGDTVLRIWNLKTGKVEKTLSGRHKYAESCVAVLPGNRVISGSSDRTLVIWDINTGNALSVLEGHRGAINCVVVLPNGQVACGDYYEILIWDLPSARSVRTLTGHGHEINDLTVLSSDRLASASRDCTIRIWNYLSGECLSVLTGHADQVYSICVLPDGRLVSAGGDHSKPNGGDSKLHVWNTETGQCIQTLEGHSQIVKCLVTVADGRVASGSYDETIILWS